ncbi:MAG: ligand-binding sensor domain-containing protein [Candidatus Rifleibacteriota bacterium]
MKSLLTGLFAAFIVWLLWPAANVPPSEKALPEGWKHFCHKDQIRALVLIDDHIYIGGLSGLTKVNWQKPDKVINVSGPDNFDLVRIEAMIADSSGTLWIGHEQGLHTLDNVSQWQNLTGQLPDPKVLAICRDPDNKIWVGTWRGVACFQGRGDCRHYHKKDGLPADRVRTIFADSQGGLWFGTSVCPKGGLVRWLDGQQWFYDTDNLLAHANVTAMLEDSNKKIWIGTGFFDKGGVTFFPDWQNNNVDSAEIYSQKTGLAGNKGRSLLQDNYKTIWIGSELDGLTAINKNSKIITFKTKDGLIGDEVMAMLQDPAGNLWLGQEEGLCRIASHTLKAVARK